MVPFWKEAMEMVLDVEPGVGFLLPLPLNVSVDASAPFS